MGWTVRECWGKGMADGSTVENAMEVTGVEGHGMDSEGMLGEGDGRWQHYTGERSRLL